MGKTRSAVAYYRTSSATNVGADKDSLKRQKEAVRSYAARGGFEVVREFYDAAVSGADPIHERPGFVDLLQYLSSNGAQVVLVETASRFARDLAVQIAGHDLMKARGYELIPADAPDYFTDETPTAVMVRQILGAVSEFEKASLVQKLRKARERKRDALGKCEGRKKLIELHPATVAEAKRLRRKSPKTGKRRSFRTIAQLLANKGHLNENGAIYSPQSIKNMIEAR